MSSNMTLRQIYPAIEAYDTGFLKVSDLHNIYYEQTGNPSGKPAVFIHGGPGLSIGPRDRRFFDPAVYRIVTYDQRGAGKSTPPAELKDNTTWHLVEDIEKLRVFLGIDKWACVFGGSWGSTLSLTYAEHHPDRVGSLIVRGIFLLRKVEFDWYYEGKGANMVYADHWEDFIAPIPESERGSMIDAYYKHLTGTDRQKQIECAKAWSLWETRTSRMNPGLINEENVAHCEQVDWLQYSRIECHYYANKGFFSSDEYILDNVDKIRHIPATIIQGRYDMVCPLATAWQLHKRWPEAEYQVVPDAGHSSKEDGIAALLVEATDKYGQL
ncbi:putative proline iminopeptidase [Tubulanus polymorphus]|uniref:putative proline iminopeptidase n=1 Tax=Tubulanus polymorphus TaxID=672921 RepID=UPI003DA5591B